MNMEEEPFIEVIQRSSTREAEIVVVGVDAIKDRDKDDALNWVLAKLARSGDTLIVLAVIYEEDSRNKGQPRCMPSFRPFRSSGQIQQIDAVTLEHLHNKISDKKELYMKSLRSFYDRCKIQGVKMKIKIAAGYYPTYIIVHEANNVGASWIVLDGKLKKYKKDIADSCGCNVAVMRRNYVASIVSSSATENKLPSYSISSEGRITTTVLPARISAGEMHANTQIQPPSIGVPVNLYLTGRGDLAKDFAMFSDSASESEIIKTPLKCSVCANTVSGKAKLSPLRQFSCDEITKITDNFARDCLLAQNGIWQIYRGSLVEDGSAEYNVLVKKFEASYFETEFKTEIDILSVARHRNILTLLGFCNGKSSPVLVYEYACNGSLDRYLSCEKEKMLPWAARRRIAMGVGKGLRYLNEECDDCTIVHRDIQPANVLLTHDFLPLISNFGCARRLQTDEVCKDCRVWGTPGYVAPECAERGIVSVKADAYSFGVLLLELISGRKALDLSRSEDQRSLVEWARPLVEIHAFHELVDPEVADTADMYELYCMISAASVCIRKDPRSRPSMSQVVSILKGGRHVIIPQSPTIL